MPLLFANFRRWSCLIHKWFCPKQVGGIQAFHWFSVTTSLYVRFGVDSLAEPLVSSSFLNSSLLDSLLGTLFPLGPGHLDLPCSVPSAGWRWAGKFTSHIWESTWVPSRHCEPVLTLLFFGFATDFFRLLIVKTLRFAFSVLVSLMFWVWHFRAWLQILGYLLLCFSNMDCLFSQTTLLLFLCFPFSSPPPSFAFVFPDPLIPGSISLTLWVSVLAWSFFLCKWLLFW